MVKIYNFERIHLDKLIEAFKSNIPDYFALHELDLFISYFDRTDYPYYIVEHEGNIVGGGGIAPEETEEVVTLTWGFIHRDFHGNKLGEALLLHRLQEMKRLYPGWIVKSDTSQLTEAFFGKYGFEVVYREDNHWFEGLHLVRIYLYPEKNIY